jgi:hypothetical protein
MWLGWGCKECIENLMEKPIRRKWENNIKVDLKEEDVRVFGG